MLIIGTCLRSHTSDGQEIFNPYHQVMPDNSEPVVATGSAQPLQHMECGTNQSVKQMDCDPTEAMQQMDCDRSQALKKGNSNAPCANTAAPSRKHETMSDIVRIVPSDANVRNPTTTHQKKRLSC
jgi:transcription factor E2F3